MSPALADHAVSFLLVLSRLGGLFVLAPMLGSAIIPARARAMLALAFAAAMFPSVTSAPHPAPELDIPLLLTAVIGETLIGVAIGLLAAIPVYAVQLSGLLMGQQMGLSLAGSYNPALESEGDALGDLLLYMAMGIFAAAGGLDALFLAVARSFQRIPLGATGLSADDTRRFPLDTLVALSTSGFELALRVAGPLVCIILLETIATGFIMKTLPQLNIMSLGFALKIVLGLLALVIALTAIQSALGDHLAASIRIMLDWAQSLCIRPALARI